MSESHFSTRMKKIKYVPEIDGLRAIAVLSVILFHADVPLFRGGYVGVDIFFVISGYLITRLIADEVKHTGSFSLSNFYIRRARRLFPALYFTFVLCFLFSFLLFTPQHFQRFGGELLYAAMSISNLYFWHESGYFNTAAEFKPLLHTWSLSVEEQFYLFWPLVLVFMLKQARQWALATTLAVIGLASLLANFVMADGYSNMLSRVSPLVASWFTDGASTIFFLTPFRIFEFAIGASLVAIKGWTSSRAWVSEASMAAGLVMIGYAVFTYDESIVFPSYNALIPCVGTALVILAVKAKFLGYVVRNRIAVSIGLISYSAYLIHWPIVVYYKYFKIYPISSGEKFLIVAASLILGYMMYRKIELPFRHPEQSASSLSKSGYGFVCASLLLLISLPAATVWANAGWQWRVPDLPAEIALQLKDSRQFHIDQFGGAGFPIPDGWISGGESGIADIVLIGDSHAEQLKTGLKELVGEKHQKSIYFSTASCLVLPGMTRLTPGTDWDFLCANALKKALAVIDRSPKALLVIAEAWNFQIKEAATVEGRRPLLEDGESYEEMYAKLSGSLDELRKRIGERRMVIIGSVPTAGVSDTIGCYLRPKFFEFDCESILSTPLESNPHVGGNKALRHYAGSRSGVHFLDPFDVLCSKESCKSFLNGKVVYSDGNHLSKDGSRILVSGVHDDILTLLNDEQKY